MIRFRGDVEGLRAVAVLLVLFDHLQVPGFPGGYIGVDVFFVISGYLITSLLAAEYAKKAEAGRGTISIPAFYARRARRILPAALTVIVAVVVAGGVLLNELRTAQIHHDAVWAAFFGSNVNFIRQATDYFTEGMSATSPFQHYWSLAVEEQFYLVWPALFLLVTRAHGLRLFGMRIPWRARVGATVCGLGAASLAWSVTTTASTPAAAYFSTFTRAWELALGALIAIATTGATVLPRRVAGAASAGGVALLVLACAVIDDATPFPGAAALLPTLATALLIVSGLGGARPLPNRVLCLPPLRFLGRISYSVYLWHWPFVVFAAALYPTMSETVQMRLLILVITLGVSALSYSLVERPGRHISLGTHRVRSLGAAVCGTCVLATVFVGLFLTINPERSTASPVAAVAALAPERSRDPIVVTVAGKAPSDPAYVEAVRAWQRLVLAGVGLRRLPPSLQPLSPHLSRAFPPPCIQGLRGTAPTECVVGNPTASHVAVLDGDSHAEMFRNSVWRAFDPKAWSIHIFARNGCGWAGRANGTVSATGCRQLQEESVRRIRALHPDVLVLSEHLVEEPFRSRAEIAASLAVLTKLAGKTIVLGHTPLPIEWRLCLAGAADMSRCTAVLDAAYRTAARLEQRLATGAGATFVDTSAWFCVRVGARTVCPPVIDGVPAFKDDTHVGAEMQLRLIPIVRALLQSAGVSPTGRALQDSSASAVVGGSGQSSVVMTVAGTVPADTRYFNEMRVWQQAVRAGIALTRLPVGLRPLGAHLARYVPPACNRGLSSITGNECVVGNPAAKRVAVLTGDSHAGMFQNAVAQALDQRSWSLHIFQRAGCGWAGTPAPNPNVTASECRFYQAETLARIRALHPQLLLLSEDRVVTPFRSQSDISSSLASFAGLARRTIVVGHTPRPEPFVRCLVGSDDISRCTALLDRYFRPFMRLEQRLATRYGMTFVDTSPWFCADAGGKALCPSVIAGAPAFKDGDHVSAELESKLVPVVRAMLESAGVSATALSRP